MDWLRRGLAFLIDLAIIDLIWSLIDNVVAYPLPDWLMALGFALWFFFYFAVSEARGIEHASVGKRITKLIVVLPGDRSPAFPAVFLRILIVLLILRVAWGEVLATLVPDAPILASILLESLRYGLILLNAWLAIWGTERMMLQDALTNTRVIQATTGDLMERDTESGELQSAGSPTIFAWLRPVVLTAAVLLAFGAIFGAHTATSGRSVFDPTGLDAGRFLEAAIVRQLQLRSDAKIESQFTIASEGIGERSLTIKVWVPYVASNDSNVEQIFDVVVQEIDFPVGYYQSGEVSVNSGIRGLISFETGQTRQLNMP